MSVTNYDELRDHIGHEIECVCYYADTDNDSDYGDPDNVSVECLTCGEVILSFDKEEK